MGRIVVGVDGSPEATAALEWALEEGRLRGSDVDVVCAFSAVPDLSEATLLADEKDAALRAEELVRSVVEPAAQSRPGVRVATRTVEGRPAQVLIEAAAGADLLVVGSRGRGGFAGLLLGSVSQQCVHHAPCPVTVVRSAT